MWNMKTATHSSLIKHGKYCMFAAMAEEKLRSLPIAPEARDGSPKLPLFLVNPCINWYLVIQIGEAKPINTITVSSPV